MSFFRKLGDFHKPSVGRSAGKNESRLLKPLNVFEIHFVAMPVPFGDQRGAQHATQLGSAHTICLGQAFDGVVHWLIHGDVDAEYLFLGHGCTSE